jgi:hypothetical protein
MPNDTDHILLVVINLTTGRHHSVTVREKQKKACSIGRPVSVGTHPCAEAQLSQSEIKQEGWQNTRVRASRLIQGVL